jgi:hypothetical protein
MRRTVRLGLSSLLLAVSVSGVCCAGSRNEPLVVVRNGKYGYIDHEGKVIIRPQFIWAEDFWHGLGTVYVCGRYVSIDSLGALFPLRIAVEGHLEPKKKGERFGFVDASGQFRIAPTFEEVLPFSDGFAAVRSGQKWGFIDTSGHVVIQPRFTAAFYFREGVATAELDSESGFVLIDTSGRVIADQLQYVDFIANGRVPAQHGEKSGYLDLAGKVAIPFVYDGVAAFSGGLAAVKKGEKWGYVNRDGDAVISPKFDHAGQFASGLAPARIGPYSGFIDKSGEFVFSLAFDQAPGFLAGDEESDLLIAPTDVSRFWTADRRFGYVNTTGRVIWGPIDGSPDHAPLSGWSAEDKKRSCEGVPESTRSIIAGFPDR